MRNIVSDRLRSMHACHLLPSGPDRRNFLSLLTQRPNLPSLSLSIDAIDRSPPPRDPVEAAVLPLIRRRRQIVVLPPECRPCWALAAPVIPCRARACQLPRGSMSSSNVLMCGMRGETPFLEFAHVYIEVDIRRNLSFAPWLHNPSKVFF